MVEILFQYHFSNIIFEFLADRSVLENMNSCMKIINNNIINLCALIRNILNENFLLKKLMEEANHF